MHGKTLKRYISQTCIHEGKESSLYRNTIEFTDGSVETIFEVFPAIQLMNVEIAPDLRVTSVPFLMPQYQYTSDSRNDMGDHHLKSKDETIADLCNTITKQKDLIANSQALLNDALETIDRKQAHLENGVALLNEGREIIESLQAQLRSKNEGVWSLITRQGEMIAQLIDEKKAPRERIEELEAAFNRHAEKANKVDVAMMRKDNRIAELEFDNTAYKKIIADWQINLPDEETSASAPGDYQPTNRMWRYPAQKDQVTK